MHYLSLCHEMRNLIQVAEGMVVERMKAHRDLRVAVIAEQQPPGVLTKQLLQYFCRMDELDASILGKMRRAETLLCEVADGQIEERCECGRDLYGDGSGNDDS